MGNPPPQNTMYQKKRKTIARKLCPSLQDDRAQRVKLLLNESLGEDVNSMFRGRTKLQVDDPLMDRSLM
jgi:hypothetical protein